MIIIIHMRIGEQIALPEVMIEATVLSFSFLLFFDFSMVPMQAYQIITNISEAFNLGLDYYYECAHEQERQSV